MHGFCILSGGGTGLLCALGGTRVPGVAEEAWRLQQLTVAEQEASEPNSSEGSTTALHDRYMQWKRPQTRLHRVLGCAPNRDRSDVQP